VSQNPCLKDPKAHAFWGPQAFENIKKSLDLEHFPDEWAKFPISDVNFI